VTAAISILFFFQHHHVTVAADADIGELDKHGTHAGLLQVFQGAVVVRSTSGKMNPMQPRFIAHLLRLGHYPRRSMPCWLPLYEPVASVATLRATPVAILISVICTLGIAASARCRSQFRRVTGRRPGHSNSGRGDWKMPVDSRPENSYLCRRR